ncbi:MAG: hypothetical protein AAF330_05755 [Pseudomonadota bacterium]
MAYYANTVEIDDVLSSIRRLVSEEARNVPPNAGRSTQGALMLTPDAMVTEEDDAEPEETAPKSLDEHSGAAALDERRVEQAFIDTIDPEASAETPEESVEEAQIREAALRAYTRASTGGDQVPRDLEIQAEPNVADVTASEAPRAAAPTGREGLEQALAELEATVAGKIADAGAEGDVDPITPEPEVNDDASDVAAHVDTDDATALDSKAANVAPMSQSASEILREAVSSAAEAVIVEEIGSATGSDAKVSPEMPEATASWVDDTPSDADPDLGARLPRDSDDDGTEVIDEHAMREMVSSMIREELQGPLGERITRNVRKLVRREIERAKQFGDLG